MKRSTHISGTMQAWSESLGIDASTVKRKLVQQEVKFEIGKPIPAKDIFRALTAESDNKIAATRKLNAEAIKTEMENQVRAGELHHISVVEKQVWQEILSPLRTELMAAHRTLGPRCTDTESATETIQSWVDGLLKKIGEKK